MGLDSVPAPFGLSRSKIELMFNKLACLETLENGNSKSSSPKERSTSFQATSKQKDKKKGEADLRAADRIMSILDAGRDALTADDLEDLCRLEK